MSDAIGGYFSLEALSQGMDRAMPGALRFCSARAAFAALVHSRRPARLWLPWLTCGVMLQVAVESGTRVMRYRLEADGSPDQQLRLEGDDLLLFVNQYGLRGSQAKAAIESFSPDRVVLDNAQAWFAPALDCLATLYSPRKFVGLPDGGLIRTRLALSVPPGNEPASGARMAHLQLRAQGRIESGLLAFRKSEASLAGESMQGMSRHTEKVLDHIDFAPRARQRRDNFDYLSARLQERNRLTWVAEADDVPICYPMLVVGGNELRRRLAEQAIFCPVYWPEVAALAGPEAAWEAQLANDVLCLPIDHRYGPAEMQRVSDTVLELLR